MQKRRVYQAPQLTAQDITALHALRQHYATLPDGRVLGRTLHRLDEMMLTALCVVLADQVSLTDMEHFARSSCPGCGSFSNSRTEPLPTMCSAKLS